MMGRHNNYYIYIIYITSEMQGIVGASKYTHKHMHMPRGTSTHT